MEKDNTIKWNKNQIELHFEKNSCKYCTCKIEEYFDPDSDEKVVNHYIDFFFDISNDKKNQQPRRKASGYVVLIRWLQSALIPRRRASGY